MNKSILCLTALILAAPVFADESRIHTTRDSGSYEATLRQAGVPLSGGMAWANHTQVPGVGAQVQVAAGKAAPAPAQTVVAKATKVAKEG